MGRCAQKLPAEFHFIQLCDAHALLICRNVLCDNIHCDLAEKEIWRDPRGRGNARRFKHIENDFPGKRPGRHAIGLQIVRHVQENFVDGVDDDILRGNILEIDLINAGAVFHIVRHPRRRNEEVDSQRRVRLQRRKEMRRPLQLVPRRVSLPLGIDLPDPLLDFKKPPTPGDAVALEGGRDSKADGLVRPALVRDDKMRIQRVEAALAALYRGIEGLQVDGDIDALFHDANLLLPLRAVLFFPHLTTNSAPLATGSLPNRPACPQVPPSLDKCRIWRYHNPNEYSLGSLPTPEICLQL